MSRRRHKPEAGIKTPPAPSANPGLARPRWFVRFLWASGILAALLIVWLIFGPSAPPTSPAKDIPEPSFTSSRFLNTGSDAHFAGTDSCTSCHRGKHRSYLLTPHSQALADVDPSAEPPDGSFVHKKSGRAYRVYRQDGKLRHQEVLRGSNGQEIGRVDLPVRWRVGSGHFARTYIVQVDGFLHESPITWYASRKQWDMSPGYDAADHLGFERPIKANCLGCHVGRVAPSETVHGHVPLERAIGCENCHGPGSLHVARRQAGQHAVGEEDLTIVNPGKLPRAELESVCSACHLQAVARVFVRGRQAGDYRPGMPLVDYCVDYRLDEASEQMTVVGHMEQLRRSACYQKTGDMSCLTCHNPHAREQPKDLTAYYRQKCLNCHTEQVCKIAHAERIRKSPADSCAACHMPHGDSDVPHVAFTHHRIGIHAKPGKSEKNLAVPSLVPVEENAMLSELDRQRNLGLAYVQATQHQELAPFAAEFAERARTNLKSVHEAGLRDADTCAALADLFLPVDPFRSRQYAQEVLQAKRLSVELRTNALILLATSEMKLKNFNEATRLLKELVPLRRASDDWGLLGICHQMQDRQSEAVSAWKQALSIRPDLPVIHLKLAEAYRKLGQASQSREHEEIARALSHPPGK